MDFYLVYISFKNMPNKYTLPFEDGYFNIAMINDIIRFGSGWDAKKVNFKIYIGLTQVRPTTSDGKSRTFR